MGSFSELHGWNQLEKLVKMVYITYDQFAQKLTYLSLKMGMDSKESSYNHTTVHMDRIWSVSYDLMIDFLLYFRVRDLSSGNNRVPVICGENSGDHSKSIANLLSSSPEHFLVEYSISLSTHGL